MNKTPILVTGSHRSGTTWVGKILGKSFELQYIHEPFNLSKHPESPITNWFNYISFEDSPIDYQNEVALYLKEFHAFSGSRLFSKIKKAKYSSKVLEELKYELKGVFGRPLFKDPIAIFSSEWFYKKFDAIILVCIRHPAAFVSSLKRLEWTFNFDELLNQDYFRSTHLNKYRDEIVLLQEREKTLKQIDIIEQAILLWKIIYSYVHLMELKYGENSRWIFVKHEDLSINPVGEFEKIFSQIGVPFTKKVKMEIIDLSKPDSDNYRAKDPQKLISIWKERLSEAEVDRIRGNLSSLEKFL